MIKQTPHGRGVFADRDYRRGDMVEACECIFVRTKYLPDSNPLSYYAFWVRRGVVALALGNGSLYNHSSTPNIYYTDSYLEPGILKLYAYRDIKAGEELTIIYNDKPQFLPKRRALFARTGSAKTKKKP
jgi:SET domain-containing protein